MGKTKELVKCFKCVKISFRHKWIGAKQGKAHDLFESKAKLQETGMDRKVQMEVGP